MKTWWRPTRFSQGSPCDEGSLTWWWFWTRFWASHWQDWRGCQVSCADLPIFTGTPSCHLHQFPVHCSWTLCIVQGSACALCRAAHCGARCKVFIRSPKQERSQPTVAALKWGGLRSPVTWSTWCWRRFLKIIMSDLIIKMAMLLIKCWQSSASRGAEQPLLVVENMLMRIVMMVMIRERVAKIRGAGSVNHSV